MKIYDGPDIRNVALIGHGDCGKTSLASALLFVAGAVNRLGRVDDGTTTTDFDDEEIERKISLQTSLAHLEWRNTKINLIDTPGYAAFVADAKAGLSIADAALLLVEAVAGVQVITERVFKYCQEYQVPRIFVINKLDRDNASFERTMSAISERFDRRAVPIQVPMGSESGFEGVIDLITMKAHRYAKDGSGQVTSGDVPADLQEMAKEYHGKLVEMVAESDDSLMEVYFESGELPHDRMVAGLHRAFLERKVFPVVVASATRAIGIRSILDAAVELMPAPSERPPRVGVVPSTGAEDSRPPSAEAPVSAFVFKTIADPYAGRMSLFRVISGTLKGDTPVLNVNRNVSERLGTVNLLQGKQLVPIAALRAGDLGVVAKLKETRTSDTLADPAAPIQYPPIAFPEPAISFAIEPKSKGDEDKISTALARLMEEDPVLRVARDSRTHELLVSGNGQVHVEVAIAKMKKKFGVEAVLKQPKVPYLETIKRKVPAVQGRHKKQTGGRGQFGDCWIELEPLPRGGGFEFVDKIFGGSIPQNFRPAVEKGIRESAERGWLSGNPVVDFRVILTDGSYHDVDSSEMAFKIAGSLAFKAAMEQARPTILEPINNVEITAPEENMGDIMGDLSSRRGKPQGMETQGRYQVIKALVPLSEMLTYASTLKSITSDRGTYHMEFDHYDEVPAQVQEKIVADYARHRQQEAEK
ncbi:MAG TPA: elongation factor G [Candidatus Polarisedimenticolaceae bacterium]|nr:elongation factor G [Candidatus Polarisedimenticolaceae bacterium]